ncbi:hypothetical protein LY28_02859 [Ruminiclostridium sufflavum DSM 19573]|uniref:Uncharacterized protein n=1 Tax=Ruminiclostridium sufflavum DSM 19573 TaxID=1121337 RepID=A0A318XHH2_9FIRM|nr:hypothetical protein [Ruminiclostridium sufflavum]PYG86640.1 hypothetical protein LY28_02859 [Ruminiclostridium sufflavum DSM 19573]
MLEVTLVLCTAIFFLSLFLLVAALLKWKKARLFLGLLIFVFSVIAMILFVNVQRINGNPDSGKEFMQLYFPLLVFAMFMAIGAVSSIRALKK